MVGKAIPATKAQKDRMDTIANYCGCLPCILENTLNRHTTIQHVTECRKRLGHDATYGACTWHHFGQLPRMHGPSLAGGMKPYRERYGPERLLVELQDYVLELFAEDPWPEYDMPVSVGRKIQAKWHTMMAD